MSGPIVIDVAPTGAERFDRRTEPVTVGLPLPRGLASDLRQFQLLDPVSSPVSLQARALDRWADGSIRWMLIDFQATIPADRPLVSYTLTTTSPPHHPAPPQPVEVHADARGVIVDTGAARFRAAAGTMFPFEHVTIDGLDVIDASRSGVVITAHDGIRLAVHIDSVTVEDAGPLRASLIWRGTVGDRDSTPLTLFARGHFFGGHAAIRLKVTLRNPHRASHPGNFWELGDRGSVCLTSVLLELALPGSGRRRIFASIGANDPWQEYTGPVDVSQSASGGPHWRSSAHVTREGLVPHVVNGYRFRTGEHEHHGLRATPIVSCGQDGTVLTVALRQFWQNFPKAIGASNTGLAVGLFPQQDGAPFELQGGEQKAHELCIAFGSDRVSNPPLAWCRHPVLACARPAWYCESDAIPHLVAAADDPHRTYRWLVDAAIDGPASFEHKREVIDEYGWRHFGDLYADHETAFPQGPSPLVSHYNNQYDAVAGFAYQFFMSADPRWWELMMDLANHVTDIDLYHTDQDRPLYNGGLFWHTAHYVDAGKSTHRSYPHAPGVPGGGPGNEHNYNTGLMLHYFLTGDPDSRDAAVQLARWVVEMDDGAHTVFRWIDRGPTGHASSTAAVDYHGPGRGPGNSIVALLNGFRLTGETDLLAKAEALIRRCIHPADDIVSRDLLDAERRWSYTVFLQALGQYLDLKIELGQRDRMYAYARTSLLQYARWMAEHERPYLETPEKLEYPTETWAAQDVRKNEVFVLAARHTTDDAERARFLDRAAFFFRASIETLRDMPTRSFARPLVLLLSYGFLYGHVLRRGLSAAPLPSDPTTDFGRPSRFVPQKQRAIRRALVLATLAGLAAVTLLAFAISR